MTACLHPSLVSLWSSESHELVEGLGDWAMLVAGVRSCMLMLCSHWRFVKLSSSKDESSSLSVGFWAFQFSANLSAHDWTATGMVLFIILTENFSCLYFLLKNTETAGPFKYFCTRRSSRIAVLDVGVSFSCTSFFPRSCVIFPLTSHNVLLSCQSGTSFLKRLNVRSKCNFECKITFQASNHLSRALQLFSCPLQWFSLGQGIKLWVHRVILWYDVDSALWQRNIYNRIETPALRAVHFMIDQVARMTGSFHLLVSRRRGICCFLR